MTRRYEMSSFDGPLRLAATVAAALLTALALGSGCGEDEETTTAGPSHILPLPCSVDSECRDSNPCTLDLCDNDGFCAHDPLPPGEAVEQVDGDCHVILCSEDGDADRDSDDSDVPDDDEPCTEDRCENGFPEHESVPDGRSCVVGRGSGTCDEGHCFVPCTAFDAAQVCDDLNPCTTDGCIEPGICAHAPISGAVPGVSQTAGDCRERRCIAGREENVEDPTDTPEDGNECTRDECVAGTPVNDALPTGTECSTGFCNEDTQCVECVAANDCPPIGPAACATAECINESCAYTYTASNTELPSALQHPNDCRLLVCDGSGDVTTIADEDDLPDDGEVCTTDVCVGYTPVYQPVTQGTDCGSGNVCDGQGNCCTPAGCGTLNCGSISDTCGGVVSCGTCDLGDTCGLSTPNVCGCTDGIHNGLERGVDCGGYCPTGCADGTSCSNGSDCASGNCIQGVCCDSACTDGCHSCLATHNGVADGQCLPVTDGTDPLGACSAQAASTCGQTGDCASGACELYPSGTECAASTCTGSTEYLADTCDGAGTCTDNGSVACGGAYVCSGPSCESCTDSVQNGNEIAVDCGGGSPCPACPDGTPCTSGTDCLTGFCVDDVCCENACDGTCVRCDLANPGTCEFVPAGEDPDNECTGGQDCDGAGACP